MLAMRGLGILLVQLQSSSSDLSIFVDTPGLLNRDDTERNKMELLTLSVLQHLPSTVLFVVSTAKGRSMYSSNVLRGQRAGHPSPTSLVEGDKSTVQTFFFPCLPPRPI